jgi:chemotaxis-related protein WspD
MTAPHLPANALQDCWNQIGVWGDGSCPKLAEVAHCRNCPVYSAAAAQLLQGETPADYLHEWAERLARPRPPAEAPETQAALIFRLGVEWLALSAAVFQEVAEMRPVHSLPHRRGRVLKGLVNVRGELIVCVSLGGLLGLGEPAMDAMNGQRPERRGACERLLVVSAEGGRLAFPVSEVHGIQRFAPAQLQAVPATVALASAHYTRGILPWEGRSVGCLDDKALFHTLNRSLG